MKLTNCWLASYLPCVTLIIELHFQTVRLFLQEMFFFNNLSTFPDRIMIHAWMHIFVFGALATLVSLPHNVCNTDSD